MIPSTSSNESKRMTQLRRAFVKALDKSFPSTSSDFLRLAQANGSSPASASSSASSSTSSSTSSSAFSSASASTEGLFQSLNLSPEEEPRVTREIINYYQQVVQAIKENAIQEFEQICLEQEVNNKFHLLDTLLAQQPRLANGQRIPPPYNLASSLRNTVIDRKKEQVAALQRQLQMVEQEKVELEWNLQQRRQQAKQITDFATQALSGHCPSPPILPTPPAPSSSAS
eukprot:TRINITY_DN6360_c0_g1_i1.p1 TRINITY_DN6360_c0_g1~~TRINITY_DN6360_c0_g1_i1.p1  ORF type:complete len:228 (-),score=35.74 TRINITY_DN6360_c0_g1_i1:50-733(-)